MISDKQNDEYISKEEYDEYRKYTIKNLPFLCTATMGSPHEPYIIIKIQKQLVQLCNLHRHRVLLDKTTVRTPCCQTKFVLNGDQRRCDGLGGGCYEKRYDWIDNKFLYDAGNPEFIGYINETHPYGNLVDY